MTYSPEDKLRDARPHVPLPASTRSRISALLSQEAGRDPEGVHRPKAWARVAVLVTAGIAVFGGLVLLSNRNSPTSTSTDSPTSSVPPATPERDAIEATLQQLPTPDGFDESVIPTLADPTAQVAAATSAVACAWIEEWISAIEAGDEARAQAARDALRSARTWAPLLGGWCRTGFGRRSRVAGEGHVGRFWWWWVWCRRRGHGVSGVGQRFVGAFRGAGAGIWAVDRQVVVHPVGVERKPSTERRARLVAAASRLKSASTLGVPRTRARRPPCRRRIMWPSLRSTLGRVAR